MMFQTTYLSFQLPNGVSQEIELERDKPITVGRNRASTIKLNLPSVSRQHANLFFEGGSFWVEDLGSSNGTYVNKEQIHRARVTSGDLIRCGEFSISVLISPQAHYQE
jgi:pSer/pThr/pTyr-binding forkhead associated (FHA) protein